MSRQAQCQLSAGRVSHHENVCWIQRILLGNLRNEAVCGCDVLECARPPAAFIAYAPVLDVPGGQAFGGERRTQMTCVAKVVLVAPEAAVNVHHHPIWARGSRQSQIPKLIAIGTVGQTSICLGWSQCQDVVGSHAQTYSRRFPSGEISTIVPSPQPYFSRESWLIVE